MINAIAAEDDYIVTPHDNGLSVRLRFDVREAWVGIRWSFNPYIWNPTAAKHWYLNVRICILPCLPLTIRWAR